MNYKSIEKVRISETDYLASIKFDKDLAKLRSKLKEKSVFIILDDQKFQVLALNWEPMTGTIITLRLRKIIDEI